MKELQEILKRIAQFEENEQAILATVVEVIGSGYRRAGARMLIDENGFSIGTVSGGCLEADVLERAKRVLQTGESTIIIYDTTKDENSVFGLSMGCRGIVRVLLESIENKSPLLDVLRISSANRERQFIGTLVSSDDGLLIGGRVFFDDNGIFDFEKLPELLRNSKKLKKDCEEFFWSNKSYEIRKYEFSRQNYEMLFEIIRPPLNLLMFGAGFDALPVVRFAKELGWRVSVIDHRPAFANRERLPEADEIIVARAEDLPEKFFTDENSAAVIMTHNYERDREILFRLLNSKCRYIGALGPRSRTNNLINELREAGRKFDEKNLEKLHAPVGLDIGSETPEEIALAVVAEIKTALSNRAGGFLREKR